MRIFPPVATVALVLVLAGCATQQESPPAEDPNAVTAVVAQGTVFQVGDAPPELCLPPIFESNPSQCSGLPLTGWDWATAEGQETASDVTWGTYAVWGDWDGTTLAVTSQIQLALYDPMPIEVPALDPANAGTTDVDELLKIQEEIATASPEEVQASWIENGYLFVTVLYDARAVQAWADGTYGAGVVLVDAALRPVE